MSHGDTHRHSYTFPYENKHISSLMLVLTCKCALCNEGYMVRYANVAVSLCSWECPYTGMCKCMPTNHHGHPRCICSDMQMFGGGGLLTSLLHPCPMDL